MFYQLQEYFKEVKDSLRRYVHAKTWPSNLEQVVHTQQHGCYCSHGHMSEPERQFRIKHLGHEIMLVEKPAGGIGEEIHIRCNTCNTDWEDVTDVSTW